MDTMQLDTIGFPLVRLQSCGYRKKSDFSKTELGKMRLDNVRTSSIIAFMEAAARFDAKLSKVEWLRCYQCDLTWTDGVCMARYDNGSGDHLFIFAKGDRIVIKGFAHESEVSPHAHDEYHIWTGLYDGIPADLYELLADPAVEKEDVTFCLWRLADDSPWEHGPVRFDKGEDSGQKRLMERIPLSADDFIMYVNEYYEGEFGGLSADQIRIGWPTCNSESDA